MAGPETGRRRLWTCSIEGGTYVWPGTGEAYGIAYMEAQAAGLPVVAQKTAGVPEVVKDGVTGTLTAAGDASAFARCHCADAWR